MNPLCPQCQTELTDDFGLVDCKSCGAVCLIDLEDNVTVQGDEQPAAEPERAAEEQEQEQEEEEQQQHIEIEPEEEAEEPEEETYAIEASSEDSDLYEEAEEIEEPVEDAEQEPEASEEIETGEAEESDSDSFNEPDNPAIEGSLMGVDFLKDLEVFSEESVATNGHVYYDFHVKGLEDKAQRELFIETVADARLEISEDAVRVLLGEETEISLPQLSFLRLTVIYKRLISLGLEMSWSLSEVQEPSTALFDSPDFSEEEDGLEYTEVEEEY